MVVAPEFALLSLSYPVVLENLIKMGKSAKLSFSKELWVNLFHFVKIFSKTANFWLKIGRNSPKL
jgi:hypothetical protein